MTSKWKMLIPGIIVVVTLVVIVYAYQKVMTGKDSRPGAETQTASTSAKNQEKNKKEAPVEEETLPPATSNADDAVNAFLEESADEQAQVAEDEEETSQINSELQEIDELNLAGSSDNL